MTPRRAREARADGSARVLGLAAVYAAACAALLACTPRGAQHGTFEDLRALREREDVSVVFVLIDALRADRLGVYGYARPTSPTIDALARSGIRFTTATSQSSWTSSSMASLWTATLPARSGVRRVGEKLPSGATTAAEALAAAGFRTVGLVRNPLVGAWLGFAQGFEQYLRPPVRNDVALVRRTLWQHPQPGSDRDLTAHAIETLRLLGGERFFLYLHFMDVHQYAHAEDGPSFGASDSDLYDAAIAWVDRNVGELVQALEQLGLRGRTLLVIASDHGEEFGEHGGNGHGKALYRESVHVPLVIAPPTPLATGIVVESSVQNVDIGPTLLDLLGFAVPERSDGRSLVPLIEAAARAGDADAAETTGAPRVAEQVPAFAELDVNWPRTRLSPRRIVAVEAAGRRLLWRENDGAPALEHYDLGADPGERHDLGAQTAPPGELAAALRAYLDARPAPWVAGERAEVDARTREQLRALGYAVE